MRYIITFMVLMLVAGLSAQGVVRTDTMATEPTAVNVNKVIYSDSLSSSFLIVVPAQVKLHKHEKHTEQVVILSGEADMLLGDKTWHIRAGDVIFIPANTPHSVKVTSKDPLRLISVQAPYFDGTDRVMLDK